MGMISRQELALIGGVAPGGAIGSVARYALGSVLQSRAGPGFPAGTLVINVVGSFLMGLLLQASLERSAMSPVLRLFLTTGFCGGFTTFSTFSYETVRMIVEGAVARAAGYVGVSLMLSLSATFTGVALARRLLALPLA